MQFQRKVSCQKKRLDEECYRNNYWYCKDRMQCIHPNLVCNDDINCVDRSDESQIFCNQTIALKCDINEGNSVLCPNEVPPFKTICARRCDGTSECIGGMDEENCETVFERIASCRDGYENLRKLIIVIASLTLIITTLAVSLFWKKTISFLHDIGQVEKTILKEPDQSRKTVTTIINVFQQRDFTLENLKDIQPIIEKYTTHRRTLSSYHSWPDLVLKATKRITEASSY